MGKFEYRKGTESENKALLFLRHCFVFMKYISQLILIRLLY